MKLKKHYKLKTNKMEAIEKTELEKAQDLINIEKQRLNDLCANEIGEILKKYSLSLVVSG